MAHAFENPEHRLAVVVGAHPLAELHDRPQAYRLAALIETQQLREHQHPGPSLRPIVCTDLWYLNDRQLMGGPAICLGSPEVNAATAYAAGRLPTALLLQDRLRIHLDPEYIDMRACVWGVDPGAGVAALDLFAERYLTDFLREARNAAAILPLA